MTCPIVTLHARRGGTGKTALAANLAVTAAQQGLRVGLVDLDLLNPGLHILFGAQAQGAGTCQTLTGDCRLEDAVQDVTNRLRMPASGKIFLLPVAQTTAAALESLPTAAQAANFYRQLRGWAQDAALDMLLLDNYPGVAEFALFWLAAADYSLLTLRLDQQDYQDTALLVELARRLEVQRLGLVVNGVTPQVLPGKVKARVEQTYAVEVLAVLPQSVYFLVNPGASFSGGNDRPLARQYLQVIEQLRKA